MTVASSQCMSVSHVQTSQSVSQSLSLTKCYSVRHLVFAGSVAYQALKSNLVVVIKCLRYVHSSGLWYFNIYNRMACSGILDWVVRVALVTANNISTYDVL